MMRVLFGRVLRAGACAVPLAFSLQLAHAAGNAAATGDDGTDAAVQAPKVQVTAGGAANTGTAVESPADTPQTVYVTSGAAMIAASGGGGSNPMRAVSLMPGVNSPAIDPYGLANIPGSNKGIRIRGELNMHGNTIGTVEGLPVMGVDPGPGYQFLLDDEDLDAIALYEGPIAPDHISFFNTAGVIDSLLRWPDATRGGQVSQSFGSNSFLRSFARADSGTLDDWGTAFFVSGSYADADKWRGPGKSPDGKVGAAFGLETHPSAAFDAKLFFAYSNMRQNTYRGLTYAQVENLGANRSLDFLPTSSATPSQAVLYYGYNRQRFSDWMLLSELRYRFSDRLSLVVKPYYFKESGEYFDGMSTGKIRNWLIDHDSYGLTSEIDTRLADTDFKLGYWWASLGVPGPPSAWKMYNPNASGTMSFAMWPILAKQTSRHTANSVYISADKRIGALQMQLGARYMREHLPGIDEYSAAGVGDVSYAAALAQSSGVIASRSVTGWTADAFLPYIAARYAIAPDLSLKASVGENFGAPGFEVWPVYQMNAATFLAKGITANMLWHAIKPETSTDVDLGLRWDFAGADIGRGYIAPTIFYTDSRHKSVSYDPGVGVSYSQNVAKAHAYGAQVLAHYDPTDTLDLFVSLTYTHDTFAADLPTLSGASASVVAAAMVKGTQLPDVPYWTSSIGANWRIGNFSVSPVLRYVGSRYGDTAHTQKVSDYVVVDLNLDYQMSLSWGTLEASLSATNLFDESYVGFINSGYYQQSSATGGIYYPGASRTIWGRIGIKI